MYSCIQCQKALSTQQIKDGGKFCSRSCAATYNNKLRRGYKQETRECLYCGKKFTVEKSNPKKYCNNSCGTKYVNENGLVKPKTTSLTPTQEFIFNNISLIHRMRNHGFSFNMIAQAFSDTLNIKIPDSTLEYNYKQFVSKEL